MSGFCEQAWHITERLRRAMIELPFNVELASGTLSSERFRFYLVQDARYLLGFGRALAIAAARAPGEEDIAFFASAAREAIAVERQLHTGYFQRFGVPVEELDRVETSPTCLAYTSYLLAVAQAGSYPELIAALLPCFWVYHEVGTELAKRQHRPAESGPGNPYQAWIDTYTDEDFSTAVATCREEVDRAADTATGHERSRMLAAFIRATEYEWMFWDSAYRMESWPTVALR
jgi:thiaminase/transcriptional activator TenA